MSTSSLPSFIKIHQAVLEKKSKMWKVYGRTTDDGRRTDGRCAMKIAHSSLRLRWAKNQKLLNMSRSKKTRPVADASTWRPVQLRMSAANPCSIFLYECHAWFHLHRLCWTVVGWLVVLRINVDLAIFQPYLDLEAGDNQSLKIQVVRPGIERRSSCSASQELNHSATAAQREVSQQFKIKICASAENRISDPLHSSATI